MKTISRYIMTLALLLTAVGGAWAQDANYDIDVNFDNQYNPNETHFDCNIHNLQNLEAEIKGTLYLSVDGDFKGSFDVDGEMVHGSIPALDAGDYTWSVVFHPEGGGEFSANGDFIINKANTSIAYYGSPSINMAVGESTELDVYINPSEAGALSYSSSDASVASITKKENGYNEYIIEAKATGTATITFSCAGSKNYDAAQDKTITVTVLTPPIKVTTNAAEEGGTFTEAWFDMPTGDVTAEYELVRDMSIQMTAQVGDGTQEQPRYRVKKDGNNWIPADLQPTDIPGLFSVIDGIENNKVLTQTTDYIVKIYAIDEQGHPTGDPMTFDNFTFEPGLYAVKAVAATNEYYDGETALSNTFKLFQGYEITVPAGEYATFYKDENICTDDENAELYTITEVTATEAVLSDAKEIMPKNTPMLIFNKGTEDKTFLLIPTTENADAVTAADQFQGTLDDKTFTDVDMQGTDYYVCTGNAFVWVKSAGTIAANRCWLEIVAQPAGVRANTRSIVSGGDTTNIDATTRDALEGDYYDLQGRKVEKPLRKGIYIKSGKKVIKH